MKFEGKIVETSEKQEYYILKEFKKNDKIYLYAIDIENNKNTNFYELVNDNMFLVTDDDILKTLLFEVVKDNRE